MKRRQWFDLHSWIGLKLCLFMAFICLTGTLAVFSAEIDWLLHPQMRVVPQPGKASWGDMVVAAQQAHPDWVLERMEAPRASRFAARATMRATDTESRFVWVDPYRGTVTGDTGQMNAQRLLRNTHRHLMLPVKMGVPLVAALSLPLLVSLVSSLYIYRQWWKGWLKWPARGVPARRLWGDVHRLAGVWTLWFVMLIGLTGAWYLVESLGAGAPPAPGADEPTPGISAAVDAATVDAALAELQRAWPQLQVRALRLADTAPGLVVEGQAQAWLVRERANNAGFDLHGGRLLQRHDGRDLGAHQRIAEMADPLHFGGFGGWPVRLLWFLAGTALTTLSFTGVYLYGRRIADALRPRGTRPAAAGPTPGTWQAAWRGMGAWRHAWTALLALWAGLLAATLAA